MQTCTSFAYHVPYVLFCRAKVTSWTGDSTAADYWLLLYCMLTIYAPGKARHIDEVFDVHLPSHLETIKVLRRLSPPGGSLCLKISCISIGWAWWDGNHVSAQFLSYKYATFTSKLTQELMFRFEFSTFVWSTTTLVIAMLRSQDDLEPMVNSAIRLWHIVMPGHSCLVSWFVNKPSDFDIKDTGPLKVWSLAQAYCKV